jgi:beta-mannosidase
VVSEDHALAAGPNRFRWRVTVERPELWWPHSLGGQPRYDVEVTVLVDGQVTDDRVLVTGLRQVRMRNFIFSVNGERLFLKGSNYGPTRRALGEVGPGEADHDVSLAREAGLDLLRVHAHIGCPELYDGADRRGVLLWQDLPLQWGYAQIRRQAIRQSRRAVNVLGHHPSVAIWCAHNEPIALDVEPGGHASRRTVLRMIRGQCLPSWNKTGLDRSVRRTLEKNDPSRPVVAHSGIFPHPAWGTDAHLYLGWYQGEERGLPGLLARLPVLARFVGEFGAQAVPDSAEFIDPRSWPDLDWDLLARRYCLQKAVFDWRVPPDDHRSFDDWRRATQDYQGDLIRYHVETLRRLKYRPTGGFCHFLLNDAQPAVTWSVLDHRRSPKRGYHALAEACAPVIIVADRPAPSYRPGSRLSLDVHVVSDLRTPIADAVATATLRWPGGARMWRLEGDIPADACTRVGRVSTVLPEPEADGDELALELELRWAGAAAAVTNSYRSRLGVVEAG